MTPHYRVSRRGRALPCVPLPLATAVAAVALAIGITALATPRASAPVLAAPLGAAHARPAEAPNAAPSAFALEAIQLVNDERAARGLPQLGYDARLFAAAEDHTAWMVAANTFSHRGEGGSTPADRALAAGYRYSALGESLARGHTSPQQVVYGRTCDRYCITACDSSYHCDGWRQSPAHWNILMGSHYRDIGAAYLRGYSSRPHWWTMMVGNSYDPPVPLGSAPPTATPSDPSPTPRPSATPRDPTATRTPTNTPRASATRTPTRVPTRTPRPSSTPVPSPTKTPAAVGYGSVTGRVLYGSDGPVAGAAIRVDGAVRAHTGSDGRFAVSGVLAGTRTVEARLDGALYSRARVSVVAARTSALGDTRLVPGDAYPSNEIDLLDLLVVASARGKCVGRSGYSITLDVDRDGCIDDDDFTLVYGSVGRKGPTAWTTSP
ncbi:MAG: CAP domain-containing protein [Anaerolineae bacterium]